MQVYRRIGLLLLAMTFTLSSVSYAQKVRSKYDGPEDPFKVAAERPAGKISAGECTANGTFESQIDVNNVRATLYNNGNLFYNGAATYEVPKGSGHHSLFATSVWIGGKVNGELRMAGATYSRFEFRPGPLFEDGSAPTNCTPYDHIWKVNKTDVQAYQAGEAPTADMQTWPTGLGAPTLDAAGNEVVPTSRDQVIDLSAGQLPKVIGDQTHWWVMNDVSAPHDNLNTDPIGVEAQVTAFAFNQAGALGNTTFYKYKLTYRGSEPLEDTYVTVWSDPDLGGAGDDRVGSDSTLGIGYVYNATDDDTAYGTQPPALGYDFFQGPLVPAAGETWTDPDGTVHQDSTRLGMTIFGVFTNGLDNQDDPGTAEEYYGYMSGFWKNGLPFTKGGSGLGFSNEEINYIFPDRPPNFWSEENFDGNGGMIQEGDRRLFQSTGPFTLNPGDVQEIVFGVVWSQATDPAGRLNSVDKLFDDDILAQDVFDLDFQLPDPPDAPQVNVSELDQQVILTWEYGPTSNNFGSNYSAVNPLLSDVADVTYDFEGFILYEFTSPGDSEGQVVAIFDKANGITQILDPNPDGTVGVDVLGTDSGLQYSFSFDNLTNYRDYYYGVQAYAYNENSAPQTYKSPIRRVMATPSRVDARDGGTVLVDEAMGASPDTVIADQGTRVGRVSAVVVDPALVTGASYRVEYKDVDVVVNEETGATATFTVYDVTNLESGRVVFDGAAYAQQYQQNTPLGEDLFSAEGLLFSIQGPSPDFDNFLVVANAAGPLDPPEYGAFAFNGNGFPHPTTADRPDGGRQQTNGSTWGIHTGDNGSRDTYAAFLNRVTNSNVDGVFNPNRLIGPYDYEIRFTEEGSLGYDPFCTGLTIPVPFELWRTGIDTPDDPSDDVRMVPYVLDNDFNGEFNLQTQASIDAAGGACAGTADHSVSSADNDPMTDWWYWATPDDVSPGEAGYRAWEEAAIALGGGDNGSFYGVLASDNSMRRMVLVNWNGGDVTTATSPADYDAEMPETGTVFRIITSKPNIAGDTFTFDTANFEGSRGDEATAEATIDQIGVVPNPYKGASAYEVSRIQDEVRFTNLPPRATIRVFTLSGALIRTLEKDSPETYLSWDLQTDSSLPLASGMYIIHVDVPGVGEKVLKFGVVKKRVQLNEL